MPSKDYLLRAYDESKTVRGFACVCTELVQKAIDIHQCSPISGMALGRLLIGALMMGDTLKGDNETLSIRINGDGELSSLLAIADSKGGVRGTISNPLVLNAKSVGEAFGKGTLTIIRDLGLKKPYTSTVPLQTGEIGDDLTFYYASSEQTPSAMGMTVIFDKETLRVKMAGGFFIQLMPDCPEPYIITIEENLSWMGSLNKVLEEECSPEHILNKVMDGLGVEINERKDVSYRCNCSKERMERALLSLPKETLLSISEDEETKITCDFCKKDYVFSKEDILALAKKK